MESFTIGDWDNAYANAPNIPGGEAYPDKWAALAASYRNENAGRIGLGIAYAKGARNSYDLFLPESSPAGLLVFVHGGYWLRFDNSFWSHLAAGPLARGFAVAMPQYSLCPQVTIGDITAEIGQAVTHAAGRIGGPIVLAGHSAGGHLAARMVSHTSPLPSNVLTRIRHTVSISGVHDLRPLLRLQLNATLRLDEAQAQAESPALLKPVEGAKVTCWVGASERSEFVRQNALLANIWRGLGASTKAVEEPDRHHFDVVEGLADAGSPLVRALFG